MRPARPCAAGGRQRLCAGRARGGAVAAVLDAGHFVGSGDAQLAGRPSSPRRRMGGALVWSCRGQHRFRAGRAGRAPGARTIVADHRRCLHGRLSTSLPLCLEERFMIRFALVVASLLVATAAPAATVVTADRYLDVLTGRYVEHPAIFIGDGGRITSIADARTVRWGADVKHVDLGGKTLVPGLIDMHVHLDGPADIGGYRGFEYTDSFWQVTAVGNARAMLDAGFTTVRNVGSGFRNDIGLMQAIRDGYAVGPRIVPAGH